MLLVKLSLSHLSVLSFQIEKGPVILIPFASELGFLSRPLGAMLIHPQFSICPARSRSNPSDKWPGNQAVNKSLINNEIMIIFT